MCRSIFDTLVRPSGVTLTQYLDRRGNINSQHYPHWHSEPFPQSDHNNLSIYHNVFIGGLARYSRWYNLANLLWPFNKPQQHISAICPQLELTAPLHQKISELSGGQRQRVALARALFQQQPVFMGDEPFSALDPLMGLRLLNLIKQAHQSVICVLHDAELALAQFDRIIVISNGKVALDDKASQLTLAHLSQHSALADTVKNAVT